MRERTEAGLEPPRLEGTLRLRSGRRLGFAEFGPAQGRPLVWFHGTPGARRQIAPATRTAARERGVRIVSVERPGVGDSTPHLYDALVEFAADVEEICDALELGRFAVGGLSGGGPYALACAHEMPERVVAAAVLGGVAPAVGAEAAAGGLVALAPLVEPLVRRVHQPLGAALAGLIRVLTPFADTAVDLFAAAMPPGDRRVFDDEATRRMFVEDLVLGSRARMQAVWIDLALFAREWGFSLGDLRVPVHLWYGESDTIVPLHHGEHVASRIPGAKLRVRAEEGHLGGLAAAHEVFDALLPHFDERSEPAAGRARRRSREGERCPTSNS